MKTKRLLFLLITVATALFSGRGVAQAASLSVVVDGLDQSRGFDFAPDGTLYVPEPGTGGSGKCQPSPSTLFQPICAGNTGKITAVAPGGSTKTLFEGFESLAEQPSLNQGAGPADIEFTDSGDAYFITGFAGYPGNRDKELSKLATGFPIPESQKATFPPSPIEDVLGTSNLAKLFKVNVETEELTELFDFGKYEITKNPDKGDVVSNPYDLTIFDDKAYVVDGGGNTYYEIGLKDGSVKTVAAPRLIIDDPVFPPSNPPAGAPAGPSDGPPPDGAPAGPPPTGSNTDAKGPGENLPGLFEPVPGRPNAISVQSVPTGNAIGPDGALYVGEYTGFPYPEGKARIFRVGEDGVPKVFAEGFTQISDIEFDENGNLLVLQFADQAPWKGDIKNLQSSLIEVAPDGTRKVLVAPGEGLVSADGITIGPDGNIYVANKAIGAGNGQIVRLDGLKRGGPEAEAVPEPMSIAAIAAFGLLGASALKRRNSSASA